MPSKVALITGASAGIGRACALEFAAKGGWNLMLIARRRDLLEELQAELKSVNESIVVTLIPLDISNAEESEKALAPASLPKIDCLVQNAGLARGASTAPQCEIKDWEEMIDVNVRALARLTLHMVKNDLLQRGSTIIMMGSTAGTWAYPGGNVYGATKAFVAQFAENLRCDLRPQGIRICNIEPGLVATDFSKVRYRGDETAAQAVYAGKQCLKPSDIARSVVWVAERPSSVSIPRLEIVPPKQAVAGYVF